MPWVVGILIASGAVAATVGACLMDRGPDWLTFMLTRGGVGLFVAGVALAVGVVVAP